MNAQLKKIGSVAQLACCASLVMAGSILASTPAKPKNIIVIVPDGCNATIQTVARWYKGADLAIDSLHTASIKTWMSNSIIPGSAAAGTAFATGFKTTEPFIGVGPRTSDAISTYAFPFPPEVMSYRPLATVLEGAKTKGKATGMIATSTISHATPASYAAHIDSRSKEDQILEHIVYQNIDVVFGGNRRQLVTRSDNENLRDTLLSRGYQYVTTRDQMHDITGGRVWGMFAERSLQPEIDRMEFAPTEPSLAEMTQKAIDILSQDPDGFFLFVEASQVDWAGHNNDPIYMIEDFLQFDEAVRVAVTFAKNDGNTVVMAFPDHNTGGMTIGSYASDNRIAYDRMPPEFLVNPLKGMKLSSSGVAKKIVNKADPVEIKAAVLEWWGITLTDSDVNEILTWPHSSSFSYRLAAVVSKNHTAIGWTTHGHNGEDVPLWSNAGISGTFENTQIAKHIFSMLDVDMMKLNTSLFNDVELVFPGKWSLDVTDATNPVLVVADAGKGFSARLPISKDEAYITEGASVVKYLLDGLVVHAPMTNRVYISKSTIDLIKAKYAAF